MKINGEEIPERMTHDEVADVFMSTAVGRSTGITREHFLALLRAKFPTEVDLALLLPFLMQQYRTTVESMLTPAEGPYTVLDHGHAIRCNTCGKTSWNSNDVLQRYCGHCHRFHED